MISLMAFATLACAGCKNKAEEKTAQGPSPLQQKVDSYAPFTLTTDLNVLSDKEKQMLPILIQIADVMDDLYWDQYFGAENRKALDTLSNPAMKAFALIQYGAWDRLDSEKPFVTGYGPRPLGANFYPTDMTQEEFEAWKDPLKTDQYSMVRRDENGQLKAIPYHVYYAQQLKRVDSLFGEAILLAEDHGLRNYLTLRREAICRTDNYFQSDMAWMDMKNSMIDFVVGPIENYDDALYGYRTSYESFILVKDTAWSNRLARFTKMLPELQKQLPCDPKYKKEVPGTSSDLNVYDAIYYAGDCNAGSKTIAINLPNDENVQLRKGSRRLQLKNAMQAKFDNIMMPIAKLMICDEQQKNIIFPAFFGNVCYHEVAHGLGVKKTVNTRQSLRDALKNQYSAWEEAKADVCGLFLVQTLIEKGEITDCTVDDAYITFIAGLLRSVRFGATEAHGIANIMCYNYFLEHGAFSKNASGKYQVNVEKAKEAMKNWAAFILQIEGEGDYEQAKSYASEHGKISADLQKDLNAINNNNIPIDINYNQGLAALGLKK
ncbi:MAG: Zn-dependent hydrolase [Bacteroidales bacterium]|nr:Zn-dependent hydrolase [Bacteroidales bacterium]